MKCIIHSILLVVTLLFASGCSASDFSPPRALVDFAARAEHVLQSEVVVPPEVAGLSAKVQDVLSGEATLLPPPQSADLPVNIQTALNDESVVVVLRNAAGLSAKVEGVLGGEPFVLVLQEAAELPIKVQTLLGDEPVVLILSEAAGLSSAVQESLRSANPAAMLQGAAELPAKVQTALGDESVVVVLRGAADLSSKVQGVLSGEPVVLVLQEAADLSAKVQEALGDESVVLVLREAADLSLTVKEALEGQSPTAMLQGVAELPAKVQAALGDESVVVVLRGAAALSSKVQGVLSGEPVVLVLQEAADLSAQVQQALGDESVVLVLREAADLSLSVEEALGRETPVTGPSAAVDLPTRIGQALFGEVGVPREVYEMAAMMERVLTSEQVNELVENYDRYMAEYRARYALAPRPAETTLGVAEAYTRRYQPGPLPRVFQTTTIYDRNGVRLAEIFDEGMRTWVPLDQISPYLIDAIIATEDSTFYTNPGVDVRRVVGAFVQNAEAGGIVSGASTITMQLARAMFFSTEERFEASMERKLFEAMLAQELSMLYTKDEILEMYLNLAHFGRLAYGAEAAAQVFFGKSAADLTLAEATLLAGTPQMPGGYDMFINFDQVKDRQRTVVSLMVRHGYLTEEEAADVLAQEVTLNPQQGQLEILAPHFVQYVTDEVGKRFPGQNVARMGMRIYTTLDMRLQERAETIVAEQVELLKPQFDMSNAALVALRPGTGEILVMVGSVDFNDLSIAGQVNVVTRKRQPGSAIKPVLYATAFEDNVVSPATVLWDVQATYKLSEDEQYRPRNYDEQMHGPVTARSALANSYNIPAVKLLDAVTVDRMLENARAMGITSLNRDTAWYGLSLTLGGGEVTLLDLTTAFHTLANAGQYLAPQAIRFTTGPEEQYNMDVSVPEVTQVLSPAAAYLVTSILSDNEARTPAFGENSPLKLSRPAAAKTGTTTDYRDNWTMGYTRYLVAGVWAGNNDGRPMRNASGVTGAAPIWHAFMEAVLTEPELQEALGAPQEDALWEFTPPDTVKRLVIECPAGIRCPAEEYFTTEWLELAEKIGPTGDFAATAPARTVYVDRGNGSQPIGACGGDGGEGRLLLRMPNGIGRGLPWLEGDEPDRFETDREYAKRVREEQAAALSWSGRNSRPLYLGPCDQAERIARSMFGNAVLAVNVGGYTDAIASDEQPPAQTGGPAYLAAATPPVSPPSSNYVALGVAHDQNCGGNFVMGQVSNGAGQAVAGVRVVYVDERGNRQETVTSGQMPGYGSFRFAIVDDSPQHISISLYNSNGAAVSSAAVVPHKQGGPTDLGCHYVIWTGTD